LAVHEIFISYSSKHRDLTKTLAAVIEAQYGKGSVWWDHALESWGDYEIQVRNALNEVRRPSSSSGRRRPANRTG
jgi:hypothetical protein